MSDESKGGLQNMITRTTATIGVKTSVFVGSAKLKTHISTLKKEIDTLIFNLGKSVYEAWEQDATDESRIAQQCRTIKEKFDNIVELNAEIVNLEQREAEVLGSKKQDSNAVPVAENTVPTFTCPACGTIYDAHSKFCRKCGAKII